MIWAASPTKKRTPVLTTLQICGRRWPEAYWLGLSRQFGVSFGWLSFSSRILPRRSRYGDSCGGKPSRRQSEAHAIVRVAVLQFADIFALTQSPEHLEVAIRGGRRRLVAGSAAVVVIYLLVQSVGLGWGSSVEQ